MQAAQNQQANEEIKEQSNLTSPYGTQAKEDNIITISCEEIDTNPDHNDLETFNSLRNSILCLDLKAHTYKYLDEIHKLDGKIKKIKENPKELQKMICKTNVHHCYSYLLSHVIDKSSSFWKELFKKSDQDAMHYADESFFVRLCDGFCPMIGFKLNQANKIYDFFVPYMVQPLLQANSHHHQERLKELLFRYCYSKLQDLHTEQKHVADTSCTTTPHDELNTEVASLNISTDFYSKIWKDDDLKLVLSQKEVTELKKITNELPRYEQKKSDNISMSLQAVFLTLGFQYACINNMKG
ncbi:MAG: hypothetical protein AAF380_00550 [Bacteroidota bacterium]